MSGVEEFVEFLLARIADDQDAALRAAGLSSPHWESEEEEVFAVTGSLADPDRCPDHPAGKPNLCDDQLVAAGCDITDNAGLMASRSVHIARHDPARVLVDCKAKRLIVEAYQQQRAHALASPADDGLMGATFGLMLAVTLLVEVYADHPDCREDWLP